MSFYRNLITTVAAMSLATAVVAADEAATVAAAPVVATEQAASTQMLAEADTTTTTTTTTDTTQTVSEQTKIDVNKATVKELMKVKGLNAARAKAIVAYRKKHGDFKSLDDLKEVNGFKKMKEDAIKKIEDQLTIG